jgi:hypothetical protein
MRFLRAFRFYPGCMGEQQVRRTCDQPLALWGALPPAPLRGAARKRTKKEKTNSLTLPLPGKISSSFLIRLYVVIFK